MKFSIGVRDWLALAPGLDSQTEWQSWAEASRPIDPAGALRKCQFLPMMMARRLSAGSRIAVDVGLELMQRHAVDALVFSSRHGELEKNYRILETLHQQQEQSPTVFAMSVHNAAVGTLTITADAELTSTAISAGIDSFQQALIESYLLLADGHQQVLLVDYDSSIPDFYLNHLPDDLPCYPYAVGLVLEAGNELSCESAQAEPRQHSDTPQSLAFLRNWLQGCKTFTLDGEQNRWQWTQQ